jgi:hypothetical protein
MRDQTPSFNLTIARPKLDFPPYSREDPYNWLRQCKKYFSLANVPIENWVSLATLHCLGTAQTWWRSLRTPAAFIHWTQFCTMLSDRFSMHSTYRSHEIFHHIKQNTSVADYIQTFEEVMSLMQMEYPNLSEPFFVSSFIAGLRDGIKHYLIPHSPWNLSEAYWKAKELEKGILTKKSMMTSSTYTPKPPSITTLPKPQANNQLANLPNQKPLPFKSKNLESVGGTMNHGHLNTNSSANSGKLSMPWQ